MNERFSEWHGGRVVGGRKKRAIQRAARWACSRWQKEWSDSARGAAAKASKRERNERWSEGVNRQGVEKREKQEIQRVARRTRRRKEKETSDSVSGPVGVSSAGERKDRFSDRHGGRIIGGRKK
jgi:hypothetical protein